MRNILRAAGVLLLMSGAQAQAVTNGGFETGSLAPWTDLSGSGSVWSVTNTDANSGTFSAVASTNGQLRQSFGPIATDSITELSFFMRQPGSSLSVWVFGYSDSTIDSGAINIGSGWTFFDLTTFLDAGKELVSFGIFGNTTTLTYFDDFKIETAASVPLPSAALLMLTGLLSFAGAKRMRRA